MSFLFNIDVNNKITKNNLYNCSFCSLNKKVPVEPTGSTEPILYFCGEAPGENEEIRRQQFVGRAGERLRQTLYSIVSNDFERKYIRWNNVVKCRPPENRTPTALEIECCSPSLLSDIETTKPIVVVTFGTVATELFLKVNDLFSISGRFFPVKIENHACFIYPMYHPSFLIRNNDVDKLYNYFFDACFRKLFETLPTLEPPLFKNDFFKDIQILTSEQDIKTELQNIGSTFSLDLETNKLRPFDNGKIISMAISNRNKTIVFPFIDSMLPYFKDFFINKTIITHNLKFELEWFIYFLGKGVVYNNEWHDTMVQAYIIDFRKSDKHTKSKGSFNLDFLILLYFGFSLKSLSPDIDRKNINRFSENLAIYNALDAKYTYKLFYEQKKYIDDNLKIVYDKTIEVTKSVALCQNKGLLFDSDFCNLLYEKYSNILDNLENEIRNIEHVKRFETDSGDKFDILSPRHISTVLADYMSANLKKTKKGNLSTDDETLSLLEKQGNILASKILLYRQFYKLKSTYIENALKLNINNKLYTNYNICFTATGRLSSGLSDEDTSNHSLNFQNFPRKSEVKDIIKAPDKHFFVAFDYSQLEVRVVAMLSLDKQLCYDILDGVDIHQSMTNEFITLYPKLEKTSNKELRNFVKSVLVFGSIYGSSADSVAHRFKSEYNVPSYISIQVYDLFWDKYFGVKKWQEELIAFYKKNGYIESPTKRRWFAPLSVRQIINYIIQSVAAFDICACAGARLSKKSVYKPHLQYVMNIHDDLSFYIPENDFEESIKEIAYEMIRPVYSWQFLPLKVKVSVGKSWGSTEETFEASLDDKNEKIILTKL